MVSISDTGITKEHQTFSYLAKYLSKNRLILDKFQVDKQSKRGAHKTIHCFMIRRLYNVLDLK